jgi:hypothetical protein
MVKAWEVPGLRTTVSAWEIPTQADIEERFDWGKSPEVSSPLLPSSCALLMEHDPAGSDL